MAQNDGKELKVKIDRKFAKKESQNVRELVERAIKYVSKKGGVTNFMGSISETDGDNRPIRYRAERPAVFNEPVNLASDPPPPVGTLGETTGV